MTSSRPLRADAVRNRERVLRAAEEVFATRGLDAPLDDIAAHAGLGVGTLYRRFPDKPSLIEALFEERVQRTVDLATSCLDDADPTAGFERWLRTTCEQLVLDKGLRQAMLSGAYGLQRTAEARGRVQPLVEHLVARAQAAGGLRTDVSATDVPMLLLMVGTVADFTGEACPGVWQRYLGLLLDGLRAGAGAEAPFPPAMCPQQLDAAMACWPGTS